MESEEESILTSKLSLFSLAHNSPEMQSPPLHTLASIPFQWEEAPGKPRKTLPPPPSAPGKSKSLELPPRLANETIKASSPMTVLDGPYKGPSSGFRSISFSSPKFGSFRSPGVGFGGNCKRKNSGRMMMVFTSSRWNIGGSKGVHHEDLNSDFSISTSSSSSCSSSSGVNEKKSYESNKVIKKISTVGSRSKSMLFTVSGATSDLVQTILKSISKRSP